MSRGELRIVVAAHKPYPVPGGAEYVPVQVGAAGKPPIPGFRRDDEGDGGISAKNPFYCELTGLWWAWKNLDCGYLGLVHYRRLFRCAPSRILDLLHEADVVLPSKRRYLIETNYSHYAHAHHARDLDLARDAVSRLQPGFLEAFDAVMRSRSGHRFNMFAMRKTLADEWCEWIFGILAEIEKKADLSAYSQYDRRVFGFLAERLLDVWIKGRALSVREVPVRNLECQHWPSKIAGFLFRKFSAGRRIDS